MGNIIRYIHHGQQVAVDEKVKGKHRDHCLCWRCACFNPGQPEHNCPIANLIYAVCIQTGCTTPVYECPEFVAQQEREIPGETGGSFE